MYLKLKHFLIAIHNRTSHNTSPFALGLAASLLLVLFYNNALWNAFFKLQTDFTFKNVIFIVSFFLTLFLFIKLMLSIVSIRYLFKPILIFIFISSSLAAYFMDSYGIMIEQTMIANTMATDFTESLELFNFNLFIHFVIYGLLPSYIVYRLNIDYKPFVRETLNRASTIAIVMLLLSGNIFLLYPEYTSFTREHRHLRHLLNPVNYLWATSVYTSKNIIHANTPLTTLGDDAKLESTWQQRGKKSLNILVVGETARAENFSLYNYARETNPELARKDIIVFDNVSSCGTTTEVSLPCIFSVKQRTNFDESTAKHQENLLDVLKKSGISVFWRENNSGCKGICKRIDSIDMLARKVDALCNDSECYDEILLHNLDEYIQKQDKDIFIVLHQKGSHGPAYYLRYPERFEKFTPVCRSNQLQECPREHVVNAYDNTILYTDYFLSRVIDFLNERATEYDTSMIYVSDHGESLGEQNFYLHGLPYMFAPDTQKHVPMLMWFSDGFEQAHGIQRTCIESKKNRDFSHDNIFHSVLGMMGVTTGVYNSELDIFNSCKTKNM